MKEPKEALLELVDQLPLDRQLKSIVRRGIQKMSPQKARQHLDNLSRVLNQKRGE